MPRLNHRWKPMRYRLRDIKVGLTRMINRLKLEAVFPEEFEDIELLQDALRVMDIYDLQPANKKRCPFCNSNQVAEAFIKDVDLTAVCESAPNDVSRTANFRLRVCKNCGVYELVEENPIRGWRRYWENERIRRSKRKDGRSDDEVSLQD